MRCNEYRELLFERMAGELTPDQELNCAAHETACSVCRAELAEFRTVSQKLRAGWPAEEPLPLNVAVQPAARRAAWLDVSAMWFSRASAIAVAACLLFVVLVRPTIHADRNGLQLAFTNAPVITANAASLNEQQVKALVQAAVDQQLGHARPVATPNAEKKLDDGRVTQVAMQVRQLQQSQQNLWQAVQQHTVYLESMWHNANAPQGQPTGGQ